MTLISNPPSSRSIFQYPPNFPNGQVSEVWLAWFQEVRANNFVFPPPVTGFALGWDAVGNLVNVPNTGADQTAAWTAADAIVAANAAAATALVRSDLSAPTGAGMVGYGAGTVKDALDSAALIPAAYQAADAVVTSAFQAADAALGTRLDAVEIGQSAAVVGYDTQANLYANLVPVAGSVAYVTNDSTPSKNGTYRKVGGTGTGSWVQSSYDRVALVEAQTAATEVSWLGDGIRNYSYLKKLSAADTVLRRTDWQGTWDLSSATRRIINKYSEPLLANFYQKSGTITQGNLTDHGLSNGATFPAAAQLDYSYLQTGDTILSATPYTATLFVKMADLSQPSVGSTTSGFDFSINIGGTYPVPTTGIVYTNLGSGLWRVDIPGVSVTVASQIYGVIRSATNSGKGFTVTGFYLTAGSTRTPYIKNPGATYLDVADYSVAADGKVTTTNTPEAGAITEWVPTTLAPASVGTRVTTLEGNRALINTSTHEIRGSYAPYLQFTPANGVGEMDGDADYALNVLGVVETMTQDTIFDAIKGRFFSTTTPSDIEWRLWVRDSIASFDTTAVTPDDSGTISAAEFPISNQIYTLRLNKAIYAASGKVVTLVMRKTNGLAVSIRRWTTAGSGGRHSFLLSSSTSWPASLSVSSLPSFGQGALQLTLGNATATANPLDIVLPPTLYALDGHEANVYFDNLINRDATDYRWDVTCSRGLQQEERWTSTLSPGTAGSVTFAVDAYPKDSETILASATSTLVVKGASAGTGLNRKVLVIGDSTTAGGITTGELVNLFSTDAMAITLLGTKGSGSNKHEGIAGWTVNKFYTDPTSPFYFGGAFNFSTYMSTNGYASVDWVLINLGINDVFNLTSDAAVDSTAATMISQLEAMILNIHVFNANVRVGIAVTTPPIATQDGFGTNYGCGQNRWRFKRNILRLARKLIDAFRGREATVSKVYIVPLLTCLDTVHNMVLAGLANANSRTTIQVNRLNNGVHPDTPGYYQCADAYYAFLKGNET